MSSYSHLKPVVQISKNDEVVQVLSSFVETMFTFSPGNRAVCKAMHS